MKIKFVTALASLITLGLFNPVLAKTDMSEMAEMDRLCVKFPHNSICKDKESYISLEKWEKNKTVCSLSNEWKNQEKKCKVIVRESELIIYIAKEAVSEALPNTLKTEVLNVHLDEIFAFDTQWWIADVKLTSLKVGGGIGNSSNYNTAPEIQNYSQSVGTFPDLKIGFMPSLGAPESPKSKFLVISSKNLHQILERMESWRYYLPDLTLFEEQLKSKTILSENETEILQNLVQLKETNECVYCDLRNVDLTEIKLENTNLEGANLEGANLEGANLEGAYLLGANLNKANLNNTNLKSANLMFVSLTEAVLIKANLKGANLQNANLESANLTEAQLNAKKFKVTNLKNANLNNANLSNADLRCTNLQFASLKKADLTNANLQSCRFTSLTNSFQLSSLQLNNRGLPYTFLDDVFNLVGFGFSLVRAISNPSVGTVINLTVPTVEYSLDSNLAGANLSGANLKGAKLKGANLTDTNFSNTILGETKLSTNQLSNANFINTDVSQVKFKNPVLICEAIFSDVSIYEEHCQEEEEEEEVLVSSTEE